MKKQTGVQYLPLCLQGWECDYFKEGNNINNCYYEKRDFHLGRSLCTNRKAIRRGYNTTIIEIRE